MTVLAPLRQSRSLSVLLAGVLLFHAGWYMLLPFLAVLFTARRGLTPAQVGLVMAAQSLTLLLGSLAGGALADRYGRKLTMLGGLALRTLGVGLLGLVAGLPASLAAAAVAGLGGGLYGPAAKAAIAVLAKGKHQATIFSLRGIAANIGTSGGPLLGTLLVRGPMPVLFGVAAALHAGLGLITWTLLKEEQRLDRQVKTPWRDILTDMPYLAFSLVTVLAWALFAQLNIAVPLFASRVLGLEAQIGLIWTLTSLTVIIFQVGLTRYLAARLHPMLAMAAGAVLLGAGLGMVGLARGFAGVLGAVLIFVVGEMFLLPTADSTVSLMARGGAVGSYFGIASFAWGLGEGLGSLVGGGLMQYALGGGWAGLPWATYAVAGAAIGGLYAGLRMWLGRRTPTAAPTPTPARQIHIHRPGFPAPEEEAVRLGPRDTEP